MVWHFHSSCHGANVTLRPSAAVRNPETFDNGITFSDSTLQAGEVVSLFFKRTTNRWAGLPRIGFTNKSPDEVDPGSLPAVYTQEVSYQSQTWAVPLEQAAENIFVDYAFDEVGLVRVGQLGRPERVLDTRGAVDFKKPVWVTIDLCGCYGCVVNSDTSAYIPQEIISLGVDARQLYIEALSQGSRSRRRTRLMLVGPERGGKTSLLKKLTGQIFDPLESCTEGIDASLTGRIDGTKSWHFHEEVTAQGKSKLVAGGGAFVDDQDILVSVWDFAGRELCSATSQVFLSHRAVYILVFNLNHDLDKPAVVGVNAPDGTYHELTRWKSMDLWMRVIHVHTNASVQLQGTTWRSPQIVIVGTHRDSLGTNVEERVGAQFAKIREALSDAPYRQHIVSRFFAVENSLEDCNDAELVALRKTLTDVCCSERYMEEEIPLKWLRFEEARFCCPPLMPIAMVRKIVDRSIGDMTDAEVWLMLKFYHDIGHIVGFDGQAERPPSHVSTEAVIADPGWLTEVFKRFTGAPEPQDPVLVKSWKRLKEEGILEERLMNHLSGEETPAGHVTSTVDDEKRALLTLMCKLDLLCERRPMYQETGAGDQMETGEGPSTAERTYFLPSSLRKSLAVIQDPHNPLSSSVFYIDFMHFLPDSLFNRLVVRALAWSQLEAGAEQEPRIAPRFASFPADCDHQVEMEMSPLRLTYVKVCITKLAIVSTSPRGFIHSPRLQTPPSPSVTCKVRDFLSVTLDSIKSSWVRGLKFRFCVPCPACNSEEDLHFLLLNECLEKERMCCPRQPSVRIDTRGIREMFCDAASMLKLDPYVMSEKHLRAIAAELGSEWEHLAVELGFTESNLYRFKQDNMAVDNSIFSMLVAWSQREGADVWRKFQELSDALVKCDRRDVVDRMLNPYV